jgi:glycosyltransferase involved in cell wall biosynthesis
VICVTLSVLLSYAALFLGLLSLYSMIAFSKKLQAASRDAIRFRVEAQGGDSRQISLSKGLPTLAVIIPAYNESANIQACVAAVLDSTNWSKLQVVVVDDQSQDDTLALAQRQFLERQDPRLHILESAPRPQGERWMGKNWACAQAMDRITTDYVLFIDADVRLASGGIEKALAFAVDRNTDLLTCWLTLWCGCWGEWLVQPIIAAMFAVGLEFPRVNDPKDATVMAVGPFMLFRRSAYHGIGGHRAAAAEIVEDVYLARRIKTQGFKLWYGLGHDLGYLQMYRSLGQLWEGWTKNWHLGSDRNTSATLYSSLAIGLIYLVPWITGFLSLVSFSLSSSGIACLAGVLSVGLVVWQIWVRRRILVLANVPGRYWWLSGLGGAIATAIPIASWIKTETGWGWTWRGRSLSLNEAKPNS